MMLALPTPMTADDTDLMPARSLTTNGSVVALIEVLLTTALSYSDGALTRLRLRFHFHLRFSLVAWREASDSSSTYDTTIQMLTIIFSVLLVRHCHDGTLATSTTYRRCGHGHRDDDIVRHGSYHDDNCLRTIAFGIAFVMEGCEFRYGHSEYDDVICC